MIEVKNVSKIYGKRDNAFAALKDVSFTIPDGATVAIVGKSGSGKSTLMHVMSGLDRASEGDVIVNGQSLKKLKRKAMDRFRARDMAFIFQSFFIEANQSCYQNVALPLEINELKRNQRKGRVEAAMARVELTEKLKQKAKNLSGGQKQRLAIARAIVNEPKLIFADEPTGNLDSATGEKIIQLLFDLNKTLGATLIMVTHDLDLAKRCKMQIAVKDGEILAIKGGKGVVAKSLKAPKDDSGNIVGALPASNSMTHETTPPPSMDVRPAKGRFRQWPGQLMRRQPGTAQPSTQPAAKPPAAASKTGRKTAQPAVKPAKPGQTAKPVKPGSPQDVQRRKLLRRRRIVQ